MFFEKVTRVRNAPPDVYELLKAVPRPRGGDEAEPLEWSKLTRALRLRPHLVALSRPGRRMTLVVCRSGAFFVSKGEVFAASLLFRTCLFQHGAVFTGTLDETSSVFTILDVHRFGLCQHRHNKMDLVDRCRLIQWVLLDMYVHDDDAPCAFETDTMWHYEDISIPARAAELEPGTRVVFRPLRGTATLALASPAASSRGGLEEEEDATSTASTRGFWAMRLPKPDCYVLYDGPTGTAGVTRRMGVDTMRTSRTMAQLFLGVSCRARLYVVCRFDEVMKRWTLSLEPDKNVERKKRCPPKADYQGWRI